MKKKALIIGIVAAVLLVAGGGYYYYSARQNAASAAVATEASMETAVASRGDLIISATGSGSVIPASKISLGFDEDGTLLELNVALGQKVKEGDVLARLQTEDTDETIQAAITAAEQSVIEAQNAISDLKANAETNRTSALNDIATYAQEVRDAQYALENYNIPTFMQGTTAVEALDQTKAALDEATTAFEPYRYDAQDSVKRRALLETLNLAQSNYDAAVKRLNYEYVLEVANANLNKARQEYEKYKDGPAADEMSLAEAQLASAQAKLAEAKKEKAIEELVAPMDGTVISLDATVGEPVTSGAIFTIADLSQVKLEVYLDETDLDKAIIGNEVEAIFDALPDDVFTGKVVAVDPSLQSISNSQAIKVDVLLEAGDKAGSLPVGLNATVDVIAGKAENAVLVPIEALRQLDEGEYAVFVVENGEPVLRVVQVGLQDITFAEIVSGLEEGEVVSTGTQATE